MAEHQATAEISDERIHFLAREAGLLFTRKENMAFARALLAEAAPAADANRPVAHQRQPVVPDGWRLVPIEPTKLMLVKGENALHRASHGDFVATEDELEAFWRAMLAAAPVAPSRDSTNTPPAKDE